ncbi:class I SAM-dependent methyltransferase [Candidatus Woesearchaeota archaeon]|nr:class I SAM-dependent methyltransferase [Candidatus Woesearchaeota archaeon]
MVIPRIQEPSELSDRVVALRFRRAPGPYPLKEDWEQDLDMIYPGIKIILESYAPRKYGKPMYGETNESETLLLASVVRWYGSHFGKRLNCVDIGTLYGRSAKMMAEESPLNGRVLTVDLTDEERATRVPVYTTDELWMRLNEFPIGAKYLGSPSSTKIKQERMDATTREFKINLKDFLGEEKIQVALIDAAHDFETVQKIFEDVILPNLDLGGTVIIDDFLKPTYISQTEFVAKTAREKSFLFYYFNPPNNPRYFPDVFTDKPSAVFFINLPEAKNRNWRNLPV